MFAIEARGATEYYQSSTEREWTSSVSVHSYLSQVAIGDPKMAP